MSVFDKILSFLSNRRERVLEGKLNCIPLPFNRFRSFLPGIEKGKYIVVTANQKVGKSKFSDYIFVYEPIFYAMQHPELKIKVVYFTLEMSAEEKYLEYLSHLLFRLDRIEISPTNLKSTNKDRPVPTEILELLVSDKYKPYIEAFERTVVYNDTDKNPTGINKFCREYAMQNGTLHYKEVLRKDPETGLEQKINIPDYYEPNDPEEYRFIILDNAANLSLEKGLNKMETVDKMSKYGITLRNQLGYTFVLIQHQNQAQEGIENQKLNRLKPSSDGLADCKSTTKDANLVIGLYSPFKYGIRDFEKYNITKLGNYCRFMEVIEDRDYGAGGQICPLYFNGASSFFAELPRPDNQELLEKVYKTIEESEKKRRD